LDEGGVLLHLGSGEYHGLNAVGQLVWELLTEEHTVAELIAVVRQRIEAPSGLEEEVLAFLEELRRRDLVEVMAA
jgi:Coenzyme PQQ synthesis protein D (PqqD)